MKQETMQSKFWQEIAEPDQPFVARICRCAGYDVYGDILNKAGYFEYLYLMMRGERPTPLRARLFERLAIALANTGPRHPQTHAAMSAGVGGSTHASCLMAALAVGAGQSGGARELFLAMECIAALSQDMEAWNAQVKRGFARPHYDGWGEVEYAPGFDPYATQCALPVVQTLDVLAECAPGGYCAWLATQREMLHQIVGHPLSMIGVAAAAFTDLQFTPAQAEITMLILRLPGAAAHALEQEALGLRKFPFFGDVLQLIDEAPTRHENTIVQEEL